MTNSFLKRENIIDDLINPGHLPLFNILRNKINNGLASSKDRDLIE